MSEYTLCVPGDPVAKARPRVYQGHAITPKKTVNAENRIYAEFRSRYPDATPFTGPVNVYMVFRMARCGKPDIDNLIKLVLDALNGVAYLDDKQVESLQAFKITPDPMVPGKNGLRKRRKEDPYTHNGYEYTPELEVRIGEKPVE